MDNKRREFLKVAGVTTLAGLGGTAVLDKLVTGTVPASAGATGGNTKEDAHEKASGEQQAPTGKRLGMVVDLRKFNQHPELFLKVQKACDKEHNIPKFENKKDLIEWIWPVGFANAFPEHSSYHVDSLIGSGQAPVFCNHCDNPPCTKACPTVATFRRESDGLVVMDYHRCIGCRFCMAACPYGMRSFNWRNAKDGLNMAEINRDYPVRMRGVVEKCNFCDELIHEGKKPKCVEACGDSKAMIFGDLNDPESEIRAVLKEHFTIQRKPSAGTHPSVFYIV